MMFTFPTATKIFFCVTPIDMRRSFDSLAERVRLHVGEDPMSGHLFVFRNREQDKIKVLYWDRDGYAIWYKRLERGSFELPTNVSGRVEMEAAQFAMMLGGLDISQAVRQERYAAPSR